MGDRLGILGVVGFFSLSLVSVDVLSKLVRVPKFLGTLTNFSKNLPIVGIYPDNWQKRVDVNFPASLILEMRGKNLPIVGIYPDNWQKSVDVNPPLPFSLPPKL